jgi:hypothetical protein
MNNYSQDNYFFENIARQEGRCYQCGTQISDSEIIVSCGRRKSYYHINCAQKLNII